MTDDKKNNNRKIPILNFKNHHKKSLHLNIKYSRNNYETPKRSILETYEDPLYQKDLFKISYNRQNIIKNINLNYFRINPFYSSNFSNFGNYYNSKICFKFLIVFNITFYCNLG